VQAFVEARCPVGVAGGRLFVAAPTYQPVDVDAVLTPLDPTEAGTVETRAREALETFLHPLRGGPTGDGWRPGQAVHLADVASVLEGVAGVDFVRELALLVDSQLRGDRVEVAAGRVVVAGTIRLRLIEG
jgi:hypothetical protein